MQKNIYSNKKTLARRATQYKSQAGLFKAFLMICLLHQIYSVQNPYFYSSHDSINKDQNDFSSELASTNRFLQGAEVDMFKIPFTKQLRSEDAAVDIVKICDGGTIFLLDSKAKKLSYALDWTEYDSKGTVIIQGTFVKIDCIPDIVVAIMFKESIPLNGDNSGIKYDVF
jgi:hypothetical protein